MGAIQKMKFAIGKKVLDGLWFIPDEPYLKCFFRILIGKRLNLENPTTFNEKLQWLKLYDRRPEYAEMADKHKAKDYVASMIGEDYVIPTLVS